MKALAKAFYAKLALSNVKRSREIYLPFFFAVMLMSGVYYLILALIANPGMNNVPNGKDAQESLQYGIIVFTLFVFFFMLYVNNFLIKRRKIEFGLYSVLGMSRRDIGKVLRWEMLIVMGLGMVCGIIFGMVFGRLLFLLMLNMINVAAAGSTFVLVPLPFIITTGLFAAVFIASALVNTIRLHMLNTTDLLKAEKKGEKDSKLVLPMAIVGLALLIGAYWFASMQTKSTESVLLFFPLVFVVIIATFILFESGSIALLRLLRRSKRIYYRASNFVSISGMFHRMRQNARGLASICIFSTMLIVTVTCTLSLYLGQEEMLRRQLPFDVELSMYKHIPVESSIVENEDYTYYEQYNIILPDLNEANAALGEIAQANNVKLSAIEGDRLYYLKDGEHISYEDVMKMSKIIVHPSQLPIKYYDNFILIENTMFFDVIGNETDCRAFVNAMSRAYEDAIYGEDEISEGNIYISSNNIFEYRQESYARFGGLLFLGIVFAVLFMAMTALMIYFKQITEGYDDKTGFTIMQQVGMTDSEVKKTINRQIIWVFLLPLLLACCHVLAANGIVSTMLGAFGLYNAALTAQVSLYSSATFAVIYLLVYWSTAKVYYRIVKR